MAAFFFLFALLCTAQCTPLGLRPPPGQSVCESVSNLPRLLPTPCDSVAPPVWSRLLPNPCDPCWPWPMPNPGPTTVCETVQNPSLNWPWLVPNAGSATVCETVQNPSWPVVNPGSATVCETVANPMWGVGSWSVPVPNPGSTTVCETVSNPVSWSVGQWSVPVPNPGSTTVCETVNPVPATVCESVPVGLRMPRVLPWLQGPTTVCETVPTMTTCESVPNPLPICPCARPGCHGH